MQSVINTLIQQNGGTAEVTTNSGMVVHIELTRVFNITRLAYDTTIVFTSVKGQIVCHNVFEAEVKLTWIMQG